MNKKFRVYACSMATKDLGIFEAKNKEDAENQAVETENCYMQLCHNCDGEIDLGEIEKFIVREVDESI